MMNFGCKGFDLKQVLKCAFGLTRAECVIFMFFLNNSTRNLTTNQISKILRFNLSTVQKAVKKLHECNVIVKYQQNLESGGYFFVYEVNSEEVIKNEIVLVVESWSKGIVSNVKATKLRDVNRVFGV